MVHQFTAYTLVGDFNTLAFMQEYFIKLVLAIEMSGQRKFNDLIGKNV